MWIYNIITDMYHGYIRLNSGEKIDTSLDINLDIKSIGIQTDDVYYTSFGTLSNDSLHLDVNYDNHYFKHLAFANQTYFEHFYDAIKYAYISFSGSFYFFCHAFWPDIYVTKGSDTIHRLSETIHEKYQNRISEILQNADN